MEVYHGSLINAPLDSVTLASLLGDAKFVLVFHSELVYEDGCNGLSIKVYHKLEDGDDYDTDDAMDDADGVLPSHLPAFLLIFLHTFFLIF